MVINSITSLAIACFIALAVFHVSNAQNTPQDYLNAHNAARSQVRVGPMQWDEKVAAYARAYVDKLKGDCKWCILGAHTPRYDYNSNTCVGGECRHYTQVVWRNSVRLGCAKVRCNNGGTIISCNYDPRGNYVNQRPY
ncbi:hypothetical protein K2173_024077 [Erythroxylum novogranatense]|uniref:SCP domain-containing protein n=1 Tax=Erythroxylum novogranatense TaxID=1862640 RepID=A0AAV8TRJ9_9ROSI|nr:hypothetical protein K2173_024077 [Erythroxylum novogranatense]